MQTFSNDVLPLPTSQLLFFCLFREGGSGNQRSVFLLFLHKDFRKFSYVIEFREGLLRGSSINLRGAKEQQHNSEVLFPAMILWETIRSQGAPTAPHRPRRQRETLLYGPALPTQSWNEWTVERHDKEKTHEHPDGNINLVHCCAEQVSLVKEANGIVQPPAEDPHWEMVRIHRHWVRGLNEEHGCTASSRGEGLRASICGRHCPKVLFRTRFIVQKELSHVQVCWSFQVFDDSCTFYTHWPCVFSLSPSSSGLLVIGCCWLLVVGCSRL